MIRHEVTISRDCYYTLLRRHNLGDAHPTLGGGERWRQADAWRAAEQSADDEIRVSRANADDFLEALDVLQRPALEYYTYATIDQQDKTMRVAVSGPDAVLVTADKRQLAVRPIPTERLAEQLVDALPETPPARMHSMSCNEKDLTAVLKNEYLATSDSVRDAKRVKRWLEKPRVNGGLFYAATRSNGTRTKTGVPVPTWIDTDEGRILLRTDESGWLTVTGADREALAQAVTELGDRLR